MNKTAKTAFATMLALALTAPPVLAAGPDIDPNGLTRQGDGKAKSQAIAGKTMTTLAGVGQCTDYGGGSGSCTGPIDHININQSVITFTMDLPASEISKLSCNGGASYANFYVAKTDNYNELYDALRYALENNNYIRLGTTGSYGCTVSYLHIYPAE